MNKIIMFFLVAFLIEVLVGVFWFLFKKLSKVGLFLTPIILGLIAAVLAPGRNPDMAVRMSYFALIIGLIIMGIFGSLSLLIATSINDLEKKVSVLKKDDNNLVRAEKALETDAKIDLNQR